MATTLLLDLTNWDLVLDISNNIALASEPYSQAQDAASEIKTFAGEVYYDTDKGVPYYASFLGKLPPLALVKTEFIDAALLVPGVVAAQCFISSFQNRELRGQVQIENDDGLTSAAGF